MSKEELAKSKKYDLRGTLLGDKAYSTTFDNSKIKRISPEFIATTSIKEGIRKTIINILSHKEYQVEDIEFDNWCDEIIKLGIIR